MDVDRSDQGFFFKYQGIFAHGDSFSIPWDHGMQEGTRPHQALWEFVVGKKIEVNWHNDQESVIF